MDNAAEEVLALLLQQVQHPAEEVQRAAAAALAALVGRAPDPHALADDVLRQLHNIYEEKLPARTIPGLSGMGVG